MLPVNEQETEEQQAAAEQETEAPEGESKEEASPLETENKKLKETLMRTLAELENTRKRALEESEKTAKYAISKFAEDLIGVMENFYLAFDNSGEESLKVKDGNKDFFDAIRMTHSELKKVFEKHGLVRIYPEGEIFDPNFHSAIAQEASDLDVGTITKVMQAGYTIKGRLLRPALVLVSKGKE
jgi:molecular chaperone GrpE